MKRSMVTSSLGLWMALALAGGNAAAETIEVDADECREAAQFIGNAALSRQNGMSKQAFVGRLDDDLMLLSAMPPERRWFAHGDAEARFLREAVLDVFDAPRAPRDHAQHFLVSCLKSAGLEDKLARVPTVPKLHEPAASTAIGAPL